MKKLTLFMALMFATSLVSVQAQVQTMHNSKAKSTVTKDQIKAWGAPGNQVASNTVALNFEGLGDMDEISQFYNGGTSLSGFSGTNYGIYFSGNALGLINIENGGTGNFINEEWSKTVMFFLTGSSVTLSVPAGFSDKLSFRYTSSAAGTVSVFDGPDGTGNLLATKPFSPLETENKGGASTGYLVSWKPFEIAFPHIALSVTITGEKNQCGFDNIILGSDKPGKGKAKAPGAAVSGATSSGSTSSGTGTSWTTAKDQTVKGRLFLSGASRLGLTVGGDKEKVDGNLVDGSKKSYFDFNFQPKAGYFIIDNLIGGLYMDVDLFSDISKEEYGYSTKGTTFSVGPFVRYYIPVCDKLIPYGEAQIGFGVDNSSSRSGSSGDWNKSKSSLFSYRIGGGATYFFNNVVGADLFAGFQHESKKYKSSGGGERSGDSKYIYNDFVLQLGIVVILDVCNH
jgi:hypothetical protein